MRFINSMCLNSNKPLYNIIKTLGKILKHLVSKNYFYYVQSSSVTLPCPTLCDPMNRSTPGLPVHHQLPEFIQTHVHQVGDAIQPSYPLSSPTPPAPNPSQHQSLFQWVNSSHEVAKVLEFQLQHQSFQWIFRTDSFRMDWLDLLSVQGTLKSLLQHHSSKASTLWRSAFFTVQLLHPYMTTGKTIALSRWIFVGKVMSLLLNMLPRLVITFLPRSKHLLISWLQSPSAVILEPPKIKSATVSTVSASICHEVMGPDGMIFVFWVLSFKPTFSLSSFTFMKRLLSSSSLSAIRVVSSAYLRLLIFLPAVLIPACVSSSPFTTYWKFVPLNNITFLSLHPHPLITTILLCVFLDPINKWYHTVPVFLWLLSLSIMCLRSIYVVTNGKISSFLMAE